MENSHEGIIPRDLFMQVQEEMLRRANLHSGEGKKKRIYSSKYALSSTIHCSKCGEIYRRVVWKNRGEKVAVWRCCTRVEHGPKACDVDSIRESALQDAVARAINETISGRESFLPVLKENIETVLDPDGEAALDEIEAEYTAAQQELTTKALNNRKYDDLIKRIQELTDRKQEILLRKANQAAGQKRMKELMDFLEKQPKAITEFDEDLVRKLIEKITVYGSRLEVEFKAGIKVDVVM